MKHAHPHLPTRIFALLALAAILVFTFASCTEKGSAEGSVKIVLAGDATVEYTVDLSDVTAGKGLKNVLDRLGETDGLKYEMSGTFLNAIGGLSPDAAKNEYIAVYTSVERDFDVSEWSSTYDYGGKTLTSSGFGILDMSVEDGAVILFTVGSF